MSEHNEEYTADDPRLTAFALGELEGDDAQAMEAFLVKSPEARAAVEEIRACTGMLELGLADEGGAELTSAQRDAIDAELEPRVLVPRKRSRVLRVGAWVATAAAVGAFVWVFLPEAMREKSEPFLYTIWGDESSGGDTELAARIQQPPSETWSSDVRDFLGEMGYSGGQPGIVNAPVAPGDISVGYSGAASGIGVVDLNGFGGRADGNLNESDTAVLQSLGYTGNDSAGVRPVISIKQDGNILHKRENYYDSANSDEFKKFTEFLTKKARLMEEAPRDADDSSGNRLRRADLGTPFEYIQKVPEINGQEQIKLWKLQLAARQHPESQPDDYEALATYLFEQALDAETESVSSEELRTAFTSVIRVPDRDLWDQILAARGSGLTSDAAAEKAENAQLRVNLEDLRRALESIDKSERERKLRADMESYAKIVDNPFVPVSDDSLSTFSIDVDTASYANTRRHLLASGTLPPPDAVRIEELINYFPYDYPSPDASQPFSVNVEIASAPWKPEHRLVKIGLKGREPVYSERKNANLVFLIDVSGSMNEPTKLPLLVDSLSMLVANLDSSDRVAIVVYAGSSGLVLDSTSCKQKPLIISALERLRAGGSTNGGQGIRLAYAVAQQNFVDGGINRVVLATDGDFNVGTTSLDALDELITEKAKDGVFLSVLGFGRANFNDSTMEMLADKGNGNYSYIDTKIEGHKVLVEQLGGTLVAIAKDVKIQIEFNPAEVQAFRLIGYENRVLAHQDFNDDTKDAGEIGSGHTVTALYEVVPHGVAFDFDGIDPLRYQADAESEKVPTEAANSGELMTLKLRYKQPEGSVSRKIVYAVHDEGSGLNKASEDFRFAASVASFGMLLRGSRYKGTANWDDTLRLAQEGQGADVGGYRLEFTYLVQRAAALSK